MNDDHLSMVEVHGIVPNIPLIIIGADTMSGTEEPLANRILAEREFYLMDLAEQSPQGEFIVAEESSHNIPTDRPDIILDMIRWLLQ